MVRGRTCSYVNLKLQVEFAAMLNSNTYIVCMLSRLGYIATNMAKAESVPSALMAYYACMLLLIEETWCYSTGRSHHLVQVSVDFTEIGSTSINTCKHTHTHIHRYTPDTCTHTHTHASTHTHTHTHIHTRVHIHTHIHMHTPDTHTLTCSMYTFCLYANPHNQD